MVLASQSRRLVVAGPLLIAALGGASLGGCGGERAGSRSLAAAAPETTRVSILRDTWGVPHVFGATDADTAMHDALAPSEDALRRAAEADAVPDVQVVQPEVRVVPVEQEQQQELESPVPSLQSETSDAGSLPLEDPDDEDAEPDWLVDAT